MGGWGRVSGEPDGNLKRCTNTNGERHRPAAPNTPRLEVAGRVAGKMGADTRRWSSSDCRADAERVLGVERRGSGSVLIQQKIA